MAATFLINRTPSPILNNNTPYEVPYKEAADYSLIRVFGCLAFASTLTANRNKFQPRARMCVFLGYHSGVKGYKLYDVVSKQIFSSRDVMFHEDIFPFHTVVKDNHLIDPFPDLVLPASSLSIHQEQLDVILEKNHSEQMPLVDSSLPPQTELTSQNAENTVEQSDNVPHVVEARRSHRVIRPPTYLKDFHCNLIDQSSQPCPQIPYHIGQFLSYENLTPIYKTLVLNVSTHHEPQYFHQAVKDPRWHEAMKLELDAMDHNHT